MNNYLDDWRNRELRSLELRAQADREHVEAEYALEMHKMQTWCKNNTSNGNGHTNAASAPRPQQTTNQPPQAAQTPQAQSQAATGVNCSQCGLEITDSGEFTIAKKVASSMKKHGRIICYKCEKTLAH